MDETRLGRAINSLNSVVFLEEFWGCSPPLKNLGTTIDGRRFRGERFGAERRPKDIFEVGLQMTEQIRETEFDNELDAETRQISHITWSSREFLNDICC